MHINVRNDINNLSAFPSELSYIVPTNITLELNYVIFNFQDNTPDSFTWAPAKNGLFSIKSCYYLLLNQPPYHLSSKPPDLTWIWQLHIQQRLKFFLWQTMHDSLPVCEKLFKRKVITSSLCPVCSLHDESIAHTLWSYDKLKFLWQNFFTYVIPFNGSVSQWIAQNCSVSTSYFNIPWKCFFPYLT